MSKVSNQEIRKKKSFFQRALDAIETAGNKLPHPTTIFVMLCGIIIALSAIFAALGTSVSYEIVDSATKELTEVTVAVRSLLSVEGIQFMFTSIISNYTGFFAMGVVFAIILCVSVAEKTGLIGAVLKNLVKVTPKRFITVVVVFLGIMANVASSAGYVVLVPLAAYIFISYKRHPIAGIAAAFAGVSGGYSANLLIGSSDPMFASIATEAANILDPTYHVLPTANWYFMIASTFVIAIIGTLVTEKIVEPRLGKYEFAADEADNQELTALEKRGLMASRITGLLYVGLILFLILPENAILNPDGNILKSPFMQSIIPIIGGFFLLTGIAFGYASKSIKSNKDIVAAMEEGIKGISGFLVLVFFAAQFVAYFNFSNLGTIMSVNGADFLKNIGLVGLPLIILFIILTAFLNLFIAVDSAKWLIIAPIFVPMFMRLGLSPETTEAIYRIGDSTTNIIAPLMPFFPLVVALCQKYDNKFGIGSVITTMLPYSVAFLLAWIVLFVIWYVCGLPLGPGAPLFYPM